MLNLAKKIEDCSCSLIHTCDIDDFIIEKGANKKIPALLKSYRSQDVVIVSDNNTHPLCGAKIAYELAANGINVTEMVYVRDGILVPDEKAIIQLLEKVTGKTDMIVAVGSGVINDICKYVSFKLKIPYIIAATAPSMDGYASTGSAMIIGNMKVTYSAHVPKAIIGDIDILKDAPFDLIKSGLGDMIGKLSSLNDWMISHIITDEILCDYVYNMTKNAVQKCINDTDGIINRDEDSIRHLMEGLVIVGVAMSYMKNSRPASGSEHHLSHFYEVINIMSGGEYLLHGIDVAYSTAVTNALRHKLAAEDSANFAHSFDSEIWQADIRRIYQDAAEGVITLQQKLGLYKDKYLPRIKERWDAICKVLLEAPSYEETCNLLKRAGLNIEEFYNLYGTEMIKNSIAYAKDLKDRYTVFWLLQDIGLLNNYAADYICQ
ncbi:MAG: sn-glycerol-1-phosphate dehydrogenase [Clostridiales bacterium]|nr:sn-glycerol-1-phosphate dehydrogenase [Clostridiales bacterium]